MVRVTDVGGAIGKGIGIGSGSGSGEGVNEDVCDDDSVGGDVTVGSSKIKSNGGEFRFPDGDGDYVFL